MAIAILKAVPTKTAVAFYALHSWAAPIFLDRRVTIGTFLSLKKLQGCRQNTLDAVLVGVAPPRGIAKRAPKDAAAGFVFDEGIVAALQCRARFRQRIFLEVA